MRNFTSYTYRALLQATHLRDYPGLNGGGLDIEGPFPVLVDLLKELTWNYVMNNPALAGLQVGGRMVIIALLNLYIHDLNEPRWEVFPASFREDAQGPGTDGARLVADVIASMSDEQAHYLFQRMTGPSAGSILDPFAR